MQDQKLENLLNLSLEVTPEERSKSPELSVGFRPENQEWELIIRYTGNLDSVRALGAEVTELLGGYAIVRIAQEQISELSNQNQISFIEKPKRLFFALDRAKAASCIDPLQETETELPYLTGQGVLLGILDSGIDLYHPAFRNLDGTTRVVVLWDQITGKVWTEEEINQALTGDRTESEPGIPAAAQSLPRDPSGHGTAVAGIAAGYDPETFRYRGIAFESRLLVVKLAQTSENGFPRTTELMRAVDFAVRWAAERELPIAINISTGNTYGSHDGTSLLETYLNAVSDYGRVSIIVGSGNEGSAAGHVQGVLTRNRTGEVELSIATYETGVSVQLWKEYADQFEIQLQAPSGETAARLSETLGPQRYVYEGTQILVYYGKPLPYSMSQEIYFDFIPTRAYLDSGIWKFLLIPRRVIRGRYDLWLPSAAVLNRSTGFLRPTPDTTLTIPSTAASVITAGAYNSTSQSYADFSGRGYTRLTNQIKPDIVAPGVDIMAPAAAGTYRLFTGTSFAAPMVTGSAALMLQWGISNGNDPFLTGEKLKAYLIRGARQLPGMPVPGPMSGWGALCVRSSLPL